MLPGASVTQLAGSKWVPQSVSCSPKTLGERLTDTGVLGKTAHLQPHLAVRVAGSRCPVVSPPYCHILLVTIRVDHVIQVMYFIPDYLSHYMKPKTSKSTLIPSFSSFQTSVHLPLELIVSLVNSTIAGSHDATMSFCKAVPLSQCESFKLKHTG